jgi:hypothetical protein
MEILKFPFLSIYAPETLDSGNPFKNISWDNENYKSIYLSDP